jgi:hypothetical protein
MQGGLLLRPATEAFTNLAELAIRPGGQWGSGSGRCARQAVMAIGGGVTSVLAVGVDAVAIAPDATLNLLVVAVNAHE